MGIVTWVVAALIAVLIARSVRVGRRRHVAIESSVAFVAALVCGLIATALDFGGWAEMDWRAGVFALAGALAAIGATRIPIDRGRADH